MQALHERGIEVAMLTGDAWAVATSVTEELEIDTVFAEVLPALFAAADDALEEMKAAGLDPRGTVSTLLEGADVVVDCTPKGVDAKNLSLYDEGGVRAV